MNFLSPDDIFGGMRRKSLCNGALLTLSSQNGKNTGSATDSANSTPSKSKKERRRGSFNEASANNSSSGRRSSLVSRWFKHISDAAEQYKPRSKNANQEPVDDPAIATLPHSNTKESLELTPERPPPMSATATVTTTPLAPMMPPPIVHTTQVNNNYDGGIQMMRNGRRESTPPSSNIASGDGGPAYQNLQLRQKPSQYELSPAINRTMSTRSCGEANNNYGAADQVATINGVTLRHTQSARQATGGGGPDGAADSSTNAQGVQSKRDSASIVYSNNSNNTRTLMQSSPPLVEPTAIQISISPAHTAEPVLTPSERLRRLDATIRDGLIEKQKIICDMFRLPVEHFHEIVDIAAMPEAPKDSADIALAAYAQVQSLTEVLNDYMHVTSEQEISAVSTAICDQCHEKQRHLQQQQQQQQGGLSTSTSSSSGVSAVTQIQSVEQTPPPLPPPNKTTRSQTAQQQTPAPSTAKLQTPIAALDEVNIHEDDDGYCEIDELRLPALPPHITTANKSSASSPTAPPPLPPPVGTFKAPPPPPPPPLPPQAQSQAMKAASSPTAELIKRQSTISSDSIPEESLDELTQAAMDDNKANVESDKIELNPSSSKEVTNNAETETVEDQQTADKSKQDDCNADAETTDVTGGKKASAEAQDNDKTATTTVTAAATVESNNNEQIAINEALSTLSKLSAVISTVDSTTQTMPLINNNIGTNTNSNTNMNGGLISPLCGPNRIQHANSLEPSIPCHALNSIVSALNSQISLLLPKINERDTERERLRKENQHLRELLNAMHERQRVEDKMETPKCNNNAAVVENAKINDEIDCTNNRKTPNKHDTPTITTAAATSSPESTNDITTTPDKVGN